MLPSHLDSLTKKANKDKVQESEALMENARKLADKLNVPEHLRVKNIGLLDTRCIYHLCKKGKEAEGGRVQQPQQHF